MKLKDNKFELYTDTSDEFSVEELLDEVEEIVNNSHEHQEDEILGSRITSAYKTLVHSGDTIVLCIGSPPPGRICPLCGFFEHFERFLRGNEGV